MPKPLEELLDELNPEQLKIVKEENNKVLITAGPGSGKTKVIVSRTAYLLNKGISPKSICIVTFTNKAASELKERMKLVTDHHKDITIGTFHAIGIMLLKRYGVSIGLKNFCIISPSEAKSIIRKILRELNEPSKADDVNYHLNSISTKRNNLITVKKALLSATTYEEKIEAEVYEKYQDIKWKQKNVDFDDILVYTYIMLKKHQHVVDKLPYLYVSVDECQDSNIVQLKLSELLCRQNIHYLGDIDQSIYAWRGAVPESFLKFDGKIMHLEQNYRSTQRIVKASKSLISNNKNRIDINLKTDNEQGDKISRVFLTDKYRESQWVANEVKHLTNSGVPGKDIAVFYRFNKQNMVLENSFSSFGIDYKVIGGLSFFDRKEIKDIICHLRIVANKNDDMALERLLSITPRVGEKTIEKIKEEQDKTNHSLLKVCKSYKFSPMQTKSISELFYRLKLIDSIKDSNPSDIIKKVIELTDCVNYYSNSKLPDDKNRADNILEFLEVVRNMEIDDGISNLQDLVTKIALSAPKSDSDDDCVSFMTLHSSKGLEFSYVFIVGCNEGSFPFGNNSSGDNFIEEERRLFYVGVTRAKKKAYVMTYDNSTDKFAKNIAHPSRFMSELPDEHCMTES